LSTDFALNRGHREILIDHYTFLLGNMVTDETLLSALLQNDVLDEQEREEIKVLKCIKAKNAKLFDFILRTTSAQYVTFLKALKDSHQEHVYAALVKGI
jgi:hypothetical protein